MLAVARITSIISEVLELNLCLLMKIKDLEVQGSSLFVSLVARGRGVLPITPPIRGGSARKGYLFQASGIYERVGILLVEVYERAGESVIWVCGRA